MSGIITIEACMNGTITRACARTLNRVLGAEFSGKSTVDEVVAFASAHAKVREIVIIDAASLAGADKARHTREVTRSRKAQARRAERKAAAAAA